MSLPTTEDCKETLAGCFEVITFTVADSQEGCCDLVVDGPPTIIDATCGESNGKATINTTYTGTEDLVYTWSPEVTTDGNMGVNLAPGEYTVTISAGPLSEEVLCSITDPNGYCTIPSNTHVCDFFSIVVGG